MNTRVRNDLFDPRLGFERGCPYWVEAVWYLCKVAFFLSALPWPSRFKAALLRVFGAQVGRHVVLKPRINIHFPWKLSIGDHAWIGEEVCILNFELVRIGAHACISQRAFLCSGNHNYRDQAMSYRNGPIMLGDGVWVGAQAFVGPDCLIGTDAMIAAGSVVTKPLPSGMVAGGNPCKVLRPRWT